MIPTVLAISLIAFLIITLPPGDYLTTYIATLEQQGVRVEIEQIDALKERYGLGQPVYIQYWNWISNIVLHGDFGMSFQWNRPVSTLIWRRLGMTLVLSFASLIIVWFVSFPLGVYSAIKQYSIGDYIATIFGFIGLAIPNFLFALVLMYIMFNYFGQSPGGFFSPEFVNVPWSWARILDLLKRLWQPAIVLGTAGTASMIRLIRANLLDELKKPYVVTARAKGLPEWKLLLKYPVRIALNFFVSRQNNLLVTLISSAAIVSIVFSLPTTGPMLLQALMAQDMYLAGSFIFLLSILNVISTLLSDIALAWLDPRIRYDD